MSDEINSNLVFLSENITNLSKVLLYLIQHKIISKNEKEEIECKATTLGRNSHLLFVLQQKDWNATRSLFLEILKNTNNDHCANVIEEREPRRSLTLSSVRNYQRKTHPKIPKWWPDKKLLIKSLHKRNYGDKLLIDELHGRILTDENRMVVICESTDAAKYTGLGGLGKTLTAKWYAHHFEQEYDHILWIDCGESRLFHSFEDLALDLEVKHLEKFNLKQIATKSLEMLSEYKCLWIYDNAESYKEEDGIINVLPKYKENFYCIITSRSREWGTKNVGFGKISDLELDIFSEEESLEFVREVLDDKIKRTDYLLKELCRLLCNLPLALQLSVAALNNGKIDLKSYIDKNKFEKVIDAKFDDYEKTINNNVRISLELILREESGKAAQEMLIIFGYIRPDDIEAEFFKETLNYEDEEIKKGIKVLKKYSLVAKSKLKFGNQSKILLSVHRLLQQVIRHNGKNSKVETLRKILSCKGFVDYKLIPFTMYADEKLQKEFPNVKAELLDQQYLRTLIRVERYDEAVQLSKFIHEELNTKVTEFNYAVCMHKNGREGECIDIFEKLYIRGDTKEDEDDMSRIVENMLEYINTTEERRVYIEQYLSLLHLGKATDLEIGDPLFYSYLRVGKIDEALIIGKQIANSSHIIKILRGMLQNGRFEDSVRLAKIIDEELKTDATKFNYAACLTKNGQFEDSVTTLEELDHKEMKEGGNIIGKEDMEEGMLELNEVVSRDLIGGHLLIVHWKMNDKNGVQDLLGKRKQFQIIPSKESFGILIQIVHSLDSNYSLLKGFHYPTIALKLGGESKIIESTGCPFELSSFDQLSPNELKIWDGSFTRNGQQLALVTVNDFLDLDKINRLSLSCGYNNNMCIDLLGEVSIKYLHLRNVKIVNWRIANWYVETLELKHFPIMEKTNLKIKELELYLSFLDISCLPQTIQKLNLYNSEVVCSCGSINLPNLAYLKLAGKSISALSHLRYIKITHIHLEWIHELNVDILPESVNQIKITGDNMIVNGGVRTVTKLILEDVVSLNKLAEFLCHFQTENLILDRPFKSKDLIRLTKKQIKTIVTGKIVSGKEDFDIPSQYVDRKADYYLWEGGKGRGIEKIEFDELKILL